MKRIAMVVVRTLGLPRHKNWRALFKPDQINRWRKSAADLHIFVHGKGKMHPKDRKFLNHDCPYEVHWCVNDTDGLFPRAMQAIFKRFKNYEFIGLLDDDGLYREPDVAMGAFLKDFDKHPKAGLVGPCHGIAVYWRLKAKGKGEADWIDGSPWSTNGSQVFRTKAIKTADMSFLDKVKFRSDMPMGMALMEAGWKLWHRKTKFDHVNILTAHDYDATLSDHRIILKQFKHNKRFRRSLRASISYIKRSKHKFDSSKEVH